MTTNHDCVYKRIVDFLARNQCILTAPGEYLPAGFGAEATNWTVTSGGCECCKKTIRSADSLEQLDLTDLPDNEEDYL